MQRNVGVSPRFQTGKISRVLWTHRGVLVDSLFTFVSINTRSTKTLAAKPKSSFVEDNYFSKTIKYVDVYRSSVTIVNDKNRSSSKQNPKQIYQAFEDVKLICQRDRGYPFNPSKMFTYKKNIIGYNRETTIICPFKHNSSVDVKNLARSDENRDQTEIRSFEPLGPVASPNEKSIFYREIAEIKEYYHQCKTASKPKMSAVNRTNKPFTMIDTDQKYWLQRYKFFERFDKGILLDRESFYSVCPELLAHHIAVRCENLVAIDPFCGAGGNVIQLAMTCKKVIAVDIDASKVRMARRNAEIYGVAHKIEFYVCDYFEMADRGAVPFRADVVVMSPPWGGPGYLSAETFSLRSVCRDRGGGARIIEIAKKISKNVAVHLPKNTNIRELISMAKDWGRIEIQQNVTNEKVNSITAFFGEFKNISNGCNQPSHS